MNSGVAPCPQAMRVVARTEATGRTASAREGAIGPPGCDAPVDSAHERYWSAGMNAAAQKKPRRKPENTSCTMGAVSQKKTIADLFEEPYMPISVGDGCRPASQRWSWGSLRQPIHQIRLTRAQGIGARLYRRFP